MLNRLKLINLLQGSSLSLNNNDDGNDAIIKMWNLFCKNSVQQEFILKSFGMNSIPCPLESVDHYYKGVSYNSSYRIVGVDGSQIYPDKHQGSLYCLINIGIVEIVYDGKNSKSNFVSEPFVYSDPDGIYSNDLMSSVDKINCIRELYEIKIGINYVINCMKNDAHLPTILLLDGSLMFWSIYGKDNLSKKYYMDQYFDLLRYAYINNVIIVSYASMPRSRDFIFLLYEIYSQEKLHSKIINFDQKYDIDLLQKTMQSLSRSALFMSGVPLIKDYEDIFHPCFSYVNGNIEIARIEILKYMTYHSEIMEMVFGILFDQINKGQGYPVALSEAHEQAVIKGADRDFFYYMIDNLHMKNNKSIIKSSKLQKKINMAV